MTVKQGFPSSSGPQTDFSVTNGGSPSRLSLRTWRSKSTVLLSSPLPAPYRHSQTTSQILPASSWASTPSGTTTYFSHTARVKATGTLNPASLAVSVTSTRTPSSMACFLEYAELTGPKGF